MSVRVVITDPAEFDANEPATVPTSITVSGSCRPDDAEVRVRATAGLTEIFDGNATVSNGDWTVNISGLPEGDFVNLHATASEGSSFDSDQIVVVVEDSHAGPPVVGRAAARQARRR